MIKIGLTGSIGMGKSETAKIFSNLGIPVYDADASVHKLYKPGNKGALAVRNLFPEAINKDGSVNRKILGDKVVGNTPNNLANFQLFLQIQVLLLFHLNRS